jgi:hypothetical protein
LILESRISGSKNKEARSKIVRKVQQAAQREAEDIRAASTKATNTINTDM